jgi:hypothetical protein
MALSTTKPREIIKSACSSKVSAGLVYCKLSPPKKKTRRISHALQQRRGGYVNNIIDNCSYSFKDYFNLFLIFFYRVSPRGFAAVFTRPPAMIPAIYFKLMDGAVYFDALLVLSALFDMLSMASSGADI